MNATNSLRSVQSAGPSRQGVAFIVLALVGAALGMAIAYLFTSRTLRRIAALVVTIAIVAAIAAVAVAVHNAQ
jgi:hypothetical protein